MKFTPDDPDLRFNPACPRCGQPSQCGQDDCPICDETAPLCDVCFFDPPTETDPK